MKEANPIVSLLAPARLLTDFAIQSLEKALNSDHLKGEDFRDKRLCLETSIGLYRQFARNLAVIAGVETSDTEAVTSAAASSNADTSAVRLASPPLV